MYDRKNLTYILTALEAIEKIFIYPEKIEGAEQFFQLNDQLNFNACQILLLAIGEETKKIDGDLKKEYPATPWHLIGGLRNRIAHDYRSIDPHISYDVIRNYLPSLKEVLVKMLPKIKYDPALLQKILTTPHYRHLAYLLS